eukprot:scaffold51652_cov61-Phaeocystis_antarctica.AAC.1
MAGSYESASTSKLNETVFDATSPGAIMVVSGTTENWSGAVGSCFSSVRLPSVAPTRICTEPSAAATKADGIGVSPRARPANGLGLNGTSVPSPRLSKASSTPTPSWSKPRTSSRSPSPSRSMNVGAGEYRPYQKGGGAVVDGGGDGGCGGSLGGFGGDGGEDGDGGAPGGFGGGRGL